MIKRFYNPHRKQAGPPLVPEMPARSPLLCALASLSSSGDTRTSQKKVAPPMGAGGTRSNPAPLPINSTKSDLDAHRDTPALTVGVSRTACGSLEVTGAPVAATPSSKLSNDKRTHIAVLSAKLRPAIANGDAAAEPGGNNGTTAPIVCTPIYMRTMMPVSPLSRLYTPTPAAADHIDVNCKYVNLGR